MSEPLGRHNLESAERTAVALYASPLPIAVMPTRALAGVIAALCREIRRLEELVPLEVCSPPYHRLDCPGTCREAPL